MPFAEAVERAGSFEVLRPHLRNGRIPARHNGIYYWPEGGQLSGPGELDPGFWAKARFEPDVIEQVILTTIKVPLYGGPERVRRVIAFGTEVERAAVESAPLKPPRRKSGTKPSKVWQQIFVHFDRLVARDGKFPSVYSAASSVEEWLKKNNKSLSRSAIERGISKYRPDWIAA